MVKRILIVMAVALAGLTFANPADAGIFHHRRVKRAVVRAAVRPYPVVRHKVHKRAYYRPYHHKAIYPRAIYAPGVSVVVGF